MNKRNDIDIMAMLITIFSIIMMIGLIENTITDNVGWLIMDLIVCVVAFVASITYEVVVYLKRKP